MNSIAPWHPCRSEAFAEDLFGDLVDAGEHIFARHELDGLEQRRGDHVAAHGHAQRLQHEVVRPGTDASAGEDARLISRIEPLLLVELVSLLKVWKLILLPNLAIIHITSLVIHMLETMSLVKTSICSLSFRKERFLLKM